VITSSAAHNSINGIQGRIDRARNSFIRAFNQMDLENANIEDNFNDVRDDVLRRLDEISRHLSAQRFE